MNSEVQPRDHARRNRMIAIAAGAITVTAIVIAFAAEYFDLPWKWLRPGVELLLLAELVGLVVLERHQLFEPVQETVGGTHALVQEMHAMITESARSSGQVTVCTSAPEIFRTLARVAREALARDQQGPQILRLARLAGRPVRESSVQEDADLAAENRELDVARSAYFVTPGSSPDVRARRWSVRNIGTAATLHDFDVTLERLRPRYAEKPSNLEVKLFARSRIEAMLSPLLMTDRDVVMGFDDAAGAFRWGIWFQGPQYLPLFVRWFDDLWASIPDRYLIYSRTGFNQSAIDRIRKELEAVESAQAG